MQKLLRYSLLVLSWLMGTPAWGSNAPIRVVLINPATPANPFWEKLTNCMRFAAEDFDMQLRVVYMDNEEITSRFAYVDAARSLSQAVVKPDYVIFMNLKGTGHRMLRLLEDAHIRSLIINSDIHPEEQAEVGKPREHFRYWIGHLSPDDEGAGYLLASRLLQMAARAHPDQVRPQMIGIGGAINGTAAEKRDQGMLRALKEANGNLAYAVNSRTWLRADGFLRAESLMHRFPEVKLYWAAADNLALGVRDAARKLKRPGVMTGGIDWTDAGLDALASGDLQVSVGGHVLEGILALTLLYDFHHGRDFASTLGVEIATDMHVAHPENLDQLRKHLREESLRADDFRRLSLIANPGRRTYDLSVSNLLGLPAAGVDAGPAGP